MGPLLSTPGSSLRPRVRAEGRRQFPLRRTIVPPVTPPGQGDTPVLAIASRNRLEGILRRRRLLEPRRHPRPMSLRAPIVVPSVFTTSPPVEVFPKLLDIALSPATKVGKAVQASYIERLTFYVKIVISAGTPTLELFLQVMSPQDQEFKDVFDTQNAARVKFTFTASFDGWIQCSRGSGQRMSSAPIVADWYRVEVQQTNVGTGTMEVWGAPNTMDHASLWHR